MARLPCAVSSPSEAAFCFGVRPAQRGAQETAPEACAVQAIRMPPFGDTAPYIPRVLTPIPQKKTPWSQGPGEACYEQP